MDTAPISLGIINKDDSTNLSRLIRDMRPYVKEIVVVDTGSRDDSVSAARKAGADNVIDGSDLLDSNGFLTSFGRARQRGMDACREPYFLWLDTDDDLRGKELLPEKMMQMKIAEKSLGVALAVRMNYEYSWNEDRSRCLQQFERERIVRLEDGWSWKRPIHEYLGTDVKHQQLLTTALTIVHLSQGSRGAINDRNLRILERWQWEGGDKEDPGALFYYLGDEHLARGNFEKAAEFFKRSINSPGVPFGHGRGLYRMLVSLNNAKLYDKVFEEAEAFGIVDAHSAFQVAMATQNSGRGPEATLAALEKAQALPLIADETPVIENAIRDSIFMLKDRLKHFENLRAQ